MKALRLLVALPVLAGYASADVTTVWTFSNPADRLAAASGTSTLTYYDVEASGWGPVETIYGKASALGLPALPGGDADVMQFPACTSTKGYQLNHNAPPNGPYSDNDGLMVSNYTVIMDLYFDSASDAKWRALLQTSTSNSNDGEFFIQDTASGGIGIGGNYKGRVTPNAWHRIAITVRAAPLEGHCQKYIDGQFVGGQGTTGSGLDSRFALDALPAEQGGGYALIFTDENNETATGYCSSFAFKDRAMFPAEIAALGGPHAGGALTPGPAMAPLSPPMVRRTGVIGHRGGAFNRAPDNTLAGIKAGIADGVQGIEVDTRLTSDGVCVCFHDDSVERTTNGIGSVDGMTLAELKLLDAGSWYDPSSSAEKVPTLQEVFAEAKGKCIIFLDMKTGNQATSIKAAVDGASFPMSDLWFWTTDDASVNEIRAVMPTAKLMWGAPDDGWSAVPTYFSDLKAKGVIGFSFAAGNGLVDPNFCARAKQEGMIVEIFTILDPDAMRQAALSGVDYVENDYPSAMNALQPVQTLAASQPFPADGATGVPRELIMRWVTGTGATQRKVYFGTTAPPSGTLPGAAVTSDLLPKASLAYNTKYFWRVDEIAPGGTTESPVWSFTTLPAPPQTQLAGLWLFDRENDIGHATIGQDLVIEGVAPEWVASQEDDNLFAVSGVMKTAFGPDNRLRCTHGIGPNGGGPLKTNRYTIVADLWTPPENRSAWRCLLQTSPVNAGDGDYFIRNSDNRVGVGDLTYSPAINAGEWTRLVFSVDMQAVASSSIIRTYMNGGAPYTHTPLAADGRIGLESSFLFFGDEDGENNSVAVGMLALYNGPLTDEEIASLGGVRAEGLFAPPAAPSIAAGGAGIQLNWQATQGFLLQKSANMQTWSDINATLSLGAYTEPRVPGSFFYRLSPK